MKIFVHGVGVLGPGIENWESCRNLFKELRPYDDSCSPDPMPSILPANERRRSSDVVRWSLHVAQEAVQQSQLDPKTMATVFASSGGEVGILHKICQSLESHPTPMVSPTLFHQSVHNAAAGYWSIASGSQRPSTSLACYDSSFGGGLLEAATLLSANQEECVLFVAYDIPAPFPLHETRPLIAPFAMAFVLSKQLHRSVYARYHPFARTHGPCPHNYASPLIRAIAVRQPCCTKSSSVTGHCQKPGLPSVYLDFLDNLQLRIDHQPCQSYPD